MLRLTAVLVSLLLCACTARTERGVTRAKPALPADAVRTLPKETKVPEHPTRHITLPDGTVVEEQQP